MAFRQAPSGQCRVHGRMPKKDGNSLAKGGKGQKDLDLDESSAVIQAFRIFQKELDNRNDRNERIVKLSRDITIESKRIIFTLQRCAGLENKKDVLNEAMGKFEELHKSKFVPLALELEGQDPYQYLKAFSPGLQEYVEAMTFFHYLTDENLVDIERVQSHLTLPVLNLMRVINSAFNSFGNIPRELRQKARVLSQSLQKVERACYTLRVRGSEIPTHMLADVFTTAGSVPSYNFHTEDMDEQFN